MKAEINLTCTWLELLHVRRITPTMNLTHKLHARSSARLFDGDLLWWQLVDPNVLIKISLMSIPAKSDQFGCFSAVQLRMMESCRKKAHELLLQIKKTKTGYSCKTSFQNSIFYIVQQIKCAQRKKKWRLSRKEIGFSSKKQRKIIPRWHTLISQRYVRKRRRLQRLQAGLLSMLFS